MPDPGPLDRLVSDGLLHLEGDRLRPTRRWRAAIARAALRLRDADERWDLRLPVACALVELHPELPDAELATLVEAMLPVERAELDPAAGRLHSVP